MGDIVIPDYIDEVIKSIDERIQEVEAILTFLREQKRSALAYKTGSPVLNTYYVVHSRSGGDDHEIVRYGLSQTFTCSCPAAKSGRKCWAVKGIQNSVNLVGRPSLTSGNSFYDDKFTRRSFGWSIRSWHDARRNIQPR